MFAFHKIQSFKTNTVPEGDNWTEPEYDKRKVLVMLVCLFVNEKDREQHEARPDRSFENQPEIKHL